MFWRKRRTPFVRPEAPREVTLAALGFVRGSVTRPRPHGWADVESEILFETQHAPMLAGLESYSHALVTFYMDLAANAPEKPVEVTTQNGNQFGILASRSQLRPNHLGVSAVRLLGVDGAVVRVRGLDAIDGTPVLDIKPYLPEYDAHPSATIPQS
ncbi:MAG: SAM-dependent methyltransferase [Tepidiformaceae bacterium]